ncbi:thioredoxin domain-containing protein [Ancylomarina sp. 16SWW S1-10-2]|uniref:thioredoxin family protein n=1 Tax=Ancylomarina sp. 16SWW S1-10-2 TaxID=2499681 RepID=UPI0012ADB36B|nr:thioredoxin domain-containing protein [Ancylomarina sp. 16SWW S1-10-2]MRT94707.1 DUF255 domain-containing protein [Ancylomarina sp. 16SWW S1-10-2]
MKKILVLVIAMFLCGSLFSQGIEFEHGTFSEAVAKAKKENKLVFMDCYTTWCGPCKYLSKTIFTQKEVGDFFNKNLVSFKLDCEKGEGPALATKFGISSYPTLLFIDGEGNAVHKLVGGMPAEDLIKGAKAALDPSMRIGTLKAKYESGNRDVEFLMTYLGAVKAQFDRENMAIVSKEIIKQTSLDKYLTKDLFYVISSANFPYGSNEFNYLLENKDKVKEITEAYEYSSLFANKIYAHLNQYAKECKNLKELDVEIQKCNKEFPLDGLAEVKKNVEYSFYIANNQLQKWYDLKIADCEALKGDKKYIYSFSGVGDEILRTPKLAASNEIVNQMIKVAHKLADQEQGVIMGNITLAKLYLHTKNKEKALKAFNIFFDINGKSGGNNTHPSVTNLKAAIEKL